MWGKKVNHALYKGKHRIRIQKVEVKSSHGVRSDRKKEAGTKKGRKDRHNTKKTEFCRGLRKWRQKK